MVQEDEYLFLDLQKLFIYNQERNEELVNEGYITEENTLTPKGKAFIERFYETHKDSVLKIYKEMMNTSYSEADVLERLRLNHFQTVRLILEKLKQEGRI